MKQLEKCSMSCSTSAFLRNITEIPSGPVANRTKTLPKSGIISKISKETRVPPDITWNRRNRESNAIAKLAIQQKSRKYSIVSGSVSLLAT
mmetsp:Transcript_24786/g.49315  ORF Transcript_24786/g.49315 Transcript_24786/m.49315 type:complete len:91 (-) Transcript_24786:307-579(-)